MANSVTGIRIICGIILFFCTPFSNGFYAMYFVGGFSDVLDGFLAGRLKTESAFGARLDTFADITFSAAVLIKVLYAVYVPLWLVIWIICIAVIKCINIVSGFAVCGSFVSEHTWLNKACGVLLYAVLPCMGRFPQQPIAVPVILTCTAAMQEGHYIRTGKEVT